MYNYSYDYSGLSNSYNYDAGAATAIFGVLTLYTILVISSMLIALAVAVVEIIGMWKVFKKAGRGGWEAIVPFYNMYTLFEISGFPGAKIFFIFIPCAGPIIYLVYAIKAAISLSYKFHKPGVFALLLILVDPVGYCILGFGKDTYDAKLGVQR